MDVKFSRGHFNSKNELMALFQPVKRCLLPTDPFFHEGDIICQKQTIKQSCILTDSEEFLHKTFKKFVCPEGRCNATFETLMDFEYHYNSCHKFRCSICLRTFPSDHLLGIHIQENHDSYFKAQLERGKDCLFECLVEGCTQTFSDVQSRKNHHVKDHKYPHDYRFDDVKANKKNQNSMDVDTHEKIPKKVSNRIPKNICFGHGSVRAFEWGSARKPNQKHGKPKQKISKTRVNIEDVTMTELKDALDEVSK